MTDRLILVTLKMFSFIIPCHLTYFVQFLKFVYASRNGLGDWECLELLPMMDWNFWAMLTHTLLNFNIIVYRAGLICLAHDQVSSFSYIYNMLVILIFMLLCSPSLLIYEYMYITFT